MMRIIRHRSGFTLVEMAIVLTVIGVVTYALLGVSGAQIEMGKAKETQSKIKRIEDALTVYFKTNGYLPCPADATQPVSSTTFGKEPAGTDHTATFSAIRCGTASDGLLMTSSSPGASALYVGATPTRTLNLPDEYMFDGWGNRITYIVSHHCTSGGHWQTPAQPTRFFQYKCSESTSGGSAATPNTDSGGAIQIRSNTSLWMATMGKPYAAYALISHGKNSYGAWSRSGDRITAPSGANTADKNNGNLSNGGAINSTVAATRTYYDVIYNGNANQDDILRYRTAPQIYYDATH